MPPAARLGDMHICPMIIPGTPPIPHVGGPITMGSPNVIIGGMPAARVSDLCLCPPVGPTDSIAVGSVSVTINGMPAARMLDSCSHGGIIAIGCPSVIIGDAALAGGGTAGAPVANAAQPPATLMISPLMRGDVMSAGHTQKMALKAASKSGIPFCAVCRKN